MTTMLTSNAKPERHGEPDRAAGAAAADRAASSPAASEFVAFRVGEEEYCIEINLVREIRRWSPATRLPHAPSYLKGVVNLRGAVVPVVDFSARLGGPVTETTERHTIVIVETEGKTLGLLVDAVSDILAADDDTLQPTPHVAPPEVHEIIAGLFVVDDRILRKVVGKNLIDAAPDGDARNPD